MKVVSVKLCQALIEWQRRVPNISLNKIIDEGLLGPEVNVTGCIFSVLMKASKCLVKSKYKPPVYKFRVSILCLVNSFHPKGFPIDE